MAVGNRAAKVPLTAERAEPNPAPMVVQVPQDSAVAAGLETLRRLEEPGVYDQLESRTRELVSGLESAARDCGVELSADAAGGMFGFGFRARAPRDFDEAKQADPRAFRRFFAEMLERGIYLAPSPFEAGFVSLAHTRRDVQRTVQAAREALQRVVAAS